MSVEKSFKYVKRILPRFRAVVKADFHEAIVSLRIRTQTILRMRCELSDFVEKSSRIFEEVHILARTFNDGVCSKLGNIEKEATAFEAFRSREERKEEKVLGTKSIQKLAGKGRVSHIGKGLETSRP